MQNIFFAWSMPGAGELGLILVIVLVLFGSTKIPQLARSVGEAIREFKKSSRDDRPDEPKNKDR